MSSDVAFFLTAARIVVARSAAEIPVVTPVAASIDPVKAVPSSVPLCLTICSNPKSSHLFWSNAKHIKPLAWVAIKFIVSDDTFSPASIKSPSFSLSSSSIRMTILPSAISVISSCMLFNFISIVFWSY